MASEDLTPRRTLAEVVEIARDLALCADAASLEGRAMLRCQLSGDQSDYDLTVTRFNAAVSAQLTEMRDAHRAGQIDAMLDILRGHRARTLRQVADGMIDLVGQRGMAVARAAVQPHFVGEFSEAGIGDLDDLTLAALDQAINRALAGVA